ncbi:MAG: GTP-binding protein [Thermoleophilia bacterium]|nr:GTP-binding protein [Thermoleophilia bacterium]MDH4346675.1 GTP-binding protein [Thermoleophilia bacterium]
MKTPVVLVTGFLGSGKTTLIARLLAHPELGETAVIVNELGEVGIDHHLLRRVDERTVLLANGCVCCTLRDDLATELRDLLDRRDAGEIPHFSRVVVETTGIADPTPIVNTLLADPLVPHHYELQTVVATVDGQHGLAGDEAVKQVAAADTLVLTKPDLAASAALDQLEGRLERINPTAPVLRVVHGDVDPATLLEHHADPRLPGRAAPAREPAHGHGESAVAAIALELDASVDWIAFGVWLTMLLQARGADVLRVKGLLDVGGDGPLLVNCVQHAVHPPVHLDAWPDDDHRSRLVFIGRGFTAAALEASLRSFSRLSPEG